jgi:hypothetical protein
MSEQNLCGLEFDFGAFRYLHDIDRSVWSGAKRLRPLRVFITSTQTVPQL